MYLEHSESQSNHYYTLEASLLGLSLAKLLVVVVATVLRSRSLLLVFHSCVRQHDQCVVSLRFVLRTKPSSTTSGCSFVRSHHADAR